MNFDNFPSTTRSFERRFSSEAQCEAYLFSQKYPDGSVCERCGSVAAPWRILSRHCLLECRDCGQQISLTTGTIFENTKKLLCDWFRALFEVAVHKTGVSAAHIARVMGFSENTGLNWLRKLRAVTLNPERAPLSGEVEADTIFFKVQDEYGKGVEVPVAVAIEVERNIDKWGREHAMPGHTPATSGGAGLPHAPLYVCSGFNRKHGTGDDRTTAPPDAYPLPRRREAAIRGRRTASRRRARAPAPARSAIRRWPTRPRRRTPVWA